jgi:hypothetical protein
MRFERDDGFGLITALMIAFVVFILAALWYAIGTHEIDEATEDRVSTAAINAAEAGAREMMYLLANDQTIRDSLETAGAVYATSPEGSACVYTELDSSGTALDHVGEYWVRVTKTPGFDLRYRIEAWGWSPKHDVRLHSEKKIDFEIELRPYGGGFDFAVFTGLNGYVGGNNKKVWGDVYTAEDFQVDNSTTVLPNDIPWPGTGAVSVVGDMTISSSASSQFSGAVRVNGNITDNKKSTLYQSDVSIGGDSSYLSQPTIVGSLNMRDTSDPGGDLSDVNEVLTGVDWTPVAPLVLPTFEWSSAPNKQATVTLTGGTWAPSELGYAGQTTSYPLPDGDVSIEFSKTEFHGDVVIYVPDGDADITKWQNVSTDSTDTPVSVAVVVGASDKTLHLAQGFTMTGTEDIHFLGYSAGTVATENNSVVYGTIYGEGGNQGQRSYVHFRPMNDSVQGVFSFDAAAADQYIPQPRIWREVPADTPGCTP